MPSIESELATSLVRCSTRNEAVPVPGGTSQILFDQDGPGTVEALWLAWGGGSPDARLKVYYDGSPTPAIDAELGVIAGYHWSGPIGDSWGHRHIQVTRSPLGVGLEFRFRMPFGSHIKIELYNPGIPGTLYSMVWYSLGTSSPLRLKASAGRYSDGTYYAQIPNNAYDYLVTSGSGYLVGVHLSGGPVGSMPTGWNWMERNIVTFVDGESAPSLTSSGTEDFFHSAYFFNLTTNSAETWFSGPFGGAPFWYGNMASDLLAFCGGIRFNTAIKVQAAGVGFPWSGNWSGNIGMAFACFYYQ